MDEAKLIELMISWETGYISPSAQIVFRDARLLIQKKNEIIRELQDALDAVELDRGNGNGGDTVAPDEPEPAAPARKLRGKKSPE